MCSHLHYGFLPSPPARLFLVGIGGIGMSALAQLLRAMGYTVAGSDRALAGGDREALWTKLTAQGVCIFPQDGSGIRRFDPGAIIKSSAVEEDNPDLAAGASLPVLGRAQALASALAQLPGRQIGIAGSCGKTTVTAWLASALSALGESVLVIGGGYANEFETASAPGNFGGTPQADWVVFEVDESDASLTEFDPHYAAVLNVGTDHFDRPKLLSLFADFAQSCSEAVVMDHSLVPALAGAVPITASFAGTQQTGEGEDVPYPDAVRTRVDGMSFTVPGWGTFNVRQYGQHSAVNAVAVLTLLRQLLPDTDMADLRQALACFRGVKRRFDLIGHTLTGAPVYDDYAHNVEKITAALHTAQGLVPGRVVAIFQPHGFGPLGFMQKPLANALLSTLRPGDTFALLPVYYAGGTTSFAPTSERVATDYRTMDLPVASYATREEATAHIPGTAAQADAVLVMGARDPTLGEWARSLIAGPRP